MDKLRMNRAPLARYTETVVDDFRKAGAPLLAELKTIFEATRVEPEAPRRAGPCTRCEGRGYTLARAGEFAVASLCGCDLACRRCDGRGYLLSLKDGYQFRETCECQSLAQRVALYNAAQIPARFHDRGFDRFVVGEGDPPKLLEAKREFQSFALAARPGAKMMGKAITGGTGRGKTHLLAATLSYLTLQRGIRARYLEISFLFADLKNAISDVRARADVDKVDELASVDVLAIDELGKGRGSTFEDEILDELIGRRYNTGKLTLFASNYPRVAQPDGLPPLSARVPPRVFSRLHDMVEWIELPATTVDGRGGRSVPEPAPLRSPPQRR